MTILSVEKLYKAYEGKAAVDGVSFSIEPGEIVGLLGPNGAGKTTTINMILGLLKPDSGAITIDGVDALAHRTKALKRTSFAAVFASLPGNLTVRQNLRVFGMIYGVKNIKARMAEMLRVFNLERFADTRVGVLSSGEQTRANLAKAMINQPQLLLLDEPTASLDPATARDIRDRIREFAASGQCGVLWTSHNMQEVVDVCDRVLFLSRGKIILEGDPATLPAAHGEDNLENLFVTLAREPLRAVQGEAA